MAAAEEGEAEGVDCSGREQHSECWEWELVATDDHVATAVEWRRAGPLGLSSRLALTWRVPEEEGDLGAGGHCGGGAQLAL